MSPQDSADFSKLECWHFWATAPESSVNVLSKGLCINSHDIEIPTSFWGRVRTTCLGPHSILPKSDYPDIVFTTSAKAHNLVKYIKQQSPNTYIVSLMASHPYADLSLSEDDLKSPAAIGLVRGHLLRHLNAMG
jgi:hypothetical protein